MAMLGGRAAAGYRRHVRNGLIGYIPDSKKFADAVKAAGGEDAAVEAWLRGSFTPSVIESLGMARARIGKILKFPFQLSRRLPSGAPIHLIFVSHNFSLGAVAEYFSGKRLSKLGGHIKYCEPVTLFFGGGRSGKMLFRGKEYKANPKPLYRKDAQAALRSFALRRYRRAKSGARKIAGKFLRRV